MRKKTFRTMAVGLTLALGLAACGGEGAGDTEEEPTTETEGEGEGEGEAAGEGGLIGVAMPTETSERWIADGANVQDGLEAAGYEVSLQYAGDDIPTQSQQIDQMITQGVDALIIAAIDGTALSGQLQAAADAGIPVISYDRLIRDSEHVD
ncbi:MAG: substrate-binding domain-containing protein, partial [Egicoccus sp.]